MAVKCPKCQLDNSETSKFCANCGTPLAAVEEFSLFRTATLQTSLRELSSGSTFAGRYQIIEELGKGGMGKVYRALDKKIGEEVALKLIKPEIASDRETTERFSNELKLARKIAHRNVGKMYELMEDGGRHFVTMEYVPGENLKSMIRMSGQLGAGTAISIARQICQGLEEAHRLGVVHRDLKPSNIMIDREGVVRIMDFGIARSLKAGRITGAGTIIGTPEYMSPEQVEGKDVDARSDIYSLGIVLFEMTTGRLPFEGDTPLSIAVKQKSEAPKDPRQWNAHISEDLSRLILRCLEKEQGKRFQSAGELRAALDRVAQGFPTTQRIPSERKSLTSKEITVKFRLRSLLRPALAVLGIAVAAILISRTGFKKKAPSIPGGKPSVAVLYFKNNTGDANFDIWRTALSDSIVTDLSQSRFINVLSTDQLLGILRRLELLEAKAYASEDVKSIAAAGRVNHVLQGSLSKAGDLFRIDYTLQDLRSGKTVGSSRVEGKGEASMFAMVDEMTRKIKQDLRLGVSEIAGDIDKSIGQITTSSPEAYKLYVEGARFHNLGDNRRAIEFYEKAVAIDPEFASAYRSMGTAYGNIGYSVKSREFRKKALELSDRVSDRERYRNEAEYYGMSDRTLDKSIDAFNKLLELYPDDSGANNNLGVTYSDLEEWDLAIDRFSYHLQAKDESPFSFGGLADCYMAKGMFEQARSVLEQYLNDFPDNSYIRFTAALHDIVQGKYDLALAEIDRAIVLAPDQFFLFGAKGFIFCCQGNLGQAEKEYQRLLDLEEPVARTWWHAAVENLRVLQGRIGESQDLLRKAVDSARRQEEKNWECFFLYRTAYDHLLMGAPQKALDVADRIWTLASDWGSDIWRIRALSIKGKARLQMNNLEAALQAAGEMMNLLDRSMRKKEIRIYYLLMGQVELEKKSFPLAIEYLEKAVSLLPGQCNMFLEMHGLYMDSLARAYWQAGDLAKARGEFEKILGLTTGRMYFGDIYAKSFYMLGKIAERQGDKVGARENYQKFLDLWKDADPGLPELEDARRRLGSLDKQPAG